MPRVLVAFVALLALLVGTAAAPSTTAPPPPPPPPRAWVAVDADTGAVVDGGNHRQATRTASLIKVLTALVIADRVAPDAVVEVSPRAEGMPARKLALKAGETWRADHLLQALLLASANDAAVALAEHTAGTVEDFGGLMADAAERLGFADKRVLQDPAGLDDEFSVGGGNLVSARDLAVATRAFLARPDLAGIVALPESRFVGGDNEPHVLRNHNRMLRLYPGAIGVKTGYTKRSGHSFIAAARRDGRTAIAVVVGAAEPYRSAGLLLDRVFAVPPSEQGALERLPRVTTTADLETEPDAVAVAARTTGDERAEAQGPPLSSRDAALLAVGGTPALAILARRRRQNRRTALIHPFRI